MARLSRKTGSSGTPENSQTLILDFSKRPRDTKDLPVLRYLPKRNTFRLSNLEYEQSIVENIPTRRWNKDSEEYIISNTFQARTALYGLTSQLVFDDHSLHILANHYEEVVNQRKGWAEAKRVKESTSLDPKDMPILYSPFIHQTQAFLVALAVEHPAFFMDPGTGKSLPTIALAGYRYLMGQIDWLIVITPPNVVGEWKAMVEEQAQFPFTLLVGENTKQIRAKLTDWKPSAGLQILITTYDLMVEAFVNDDLGFNDCMKVLLKSRLMTVLDEAHKIKKHTSLRAKVAVRLGKISKYRAILTGTPISEPPDIFSEFLFLDSRLFGTSFPKFKDEYCVMGGNPHGHQQWIKGYKNLDKLAEKIHRVAVRVTLDECEMALPPFYDSEKIVELEPKARKLYDGLEKDSLVEIRGNEIYSPIPLTTYTILHQLVGGYIRSKGELFQVSKAKLKLLLEQVDSITQGDRKVVIFTKFDAEREAIAEALDAKKVKYYQIHGGVKPAERQKLKEAFEKKKEVKVFVIQIAAGGIGITLVSANYGIFYSVDWNFIDYYQARARVRRIGQDKEVFYIHLVAKDTIDEDIMEVLKERMKRAKEILDDPRLSKAQKDVRLAQELKTSERDIALQMFRRKGKKYNG